MNDTDVIIIGGGISGLSTAWWLAQAGVCVQVWESDHRLGGKISSHQQEGYLTEQAASLLMNFLPEVAQLVEETGLELLKTQRSKQSKLHRYLLHQGELQALPMQIIGLLRSPLWSLRGKLRLLLEPFIPAGSHKNETVSQFIRRRLGNEMLEKAMEPFVAGTLASDPNLASADATLPRLTALENRYGSITAGILSHKILRRRTACKSEVFSFTGGMQTLINALSQHPKIQIRSNRCVQNLTPTKNGWSVTATTPSGECSLQTSHVIIATPAPMAAKLVSGISDDLTSMLSAIEYASLTVLHMGIKRNNVGHALDGIGFLAPRREQQPFTGNLWMSSQFSDRAPKDKVLLTTYLGGSRNPESIHWNDSRLIDTALQALTPLLDLKGSPDMLRINRHRQALPLYYGAYLARDREISKQLQHFPGLHIEANYRGGVSVRDRIARGQQLARSISSQFALNRENQSQIEAVGDLIMT